MNIQIAEYMSRNETKDLLGVPRDHRFEVVSLLVHTAFLEAGDMYESSDVYLVGLLERGRLL
jgi:hypothetical protein